MNSESTNFNEGNTLKSLDELCDEFESAWQSGDEPSLADFLARVEQPHKGAALQELLALELEYLREAGRNVEPSDYHRQFSEFATVIDEVFGTQGRKTTDRMSQAATLPVTGKPMSGGQTIAEGRGSLGGRYRIVELHAKGGLGEVFVAEDTELNRRVALKEIQTRYAAVEESRTRFLREATITGGLEHPGIVPVYGLGSYEDGRPYYAMRFVKGETLQDAINAFHERKHDQSGRGIRGLELRRLLRHFVDVCNAIDYAHSKGVIHRDLKPANVMLGKHGETLVVDWGLAKTLDLTEYAPQNLGDSILIVEPSHDSARTQMGSVMGTPAYMSPEQAAGNTARQGTASDVYSLGATLYHLLTGKAAFTSGKDILERVQAGRFPRPCEIESGVPNSLEAVVLKAMSLRTEDRYQTAAALAEDVEKWLGDEPLSAYHEPFAQRCVRWCRRHQTIAASTAVAIVLLSFAASVVYAQSQRAAQREQTRQAEIESRTLRYQQELRQREEKRIAAIRFTAESNQQSALSQLRADAFASAKAFLDEALSNLPELPEVGDLRANLEVQRTRVNQLIRFEKLADDAWFLAGDNRFAAASKVCEEATSLLGADKHDDWWEHLPTGDLTEVQHARLAQEVHRLLLLQGSLLAMRALLDLTSPERKADCEQALVILAKAQAFEPTHFNRLVETFCYFRMGQFDKVKPLESIEPESPTDYFLFGFIYWHVAQVPDAAPSNFVMNMVQKAAGLEFTDPWSKAYRCFREAALLEPKRYWTQYTLAWFMIEANDPFHGEMALNACLALRPELAITHTARGVALMKQGQQLGDASLLEQGERSFEHALALARDQRERLTVYALRRGQLYAAGRTTEALGDIYRLSELYPADEQYKINLQSLLADCRFVLDQDSSSLKARESLALVLLKLQEFEMARQEADNLLEGNADHVVGLTVRGACRLERNELSDALDDFGRALSLDGDCFLAAIGRGHTLEKLKRYDDAFAAFQSAESICKVNWQRLQVLEGQARLVKEVGRENELARLRSQIESTKSEIEMGDP